MDCASASAIALKSRVSSPSSSGCSGMRSPSSPRAMRPAPCRSASTGRSTRRDSAALSPAATAKATATVSTTEISRLRCSCRICPKSCDTRSTRAPSLTATYR